MTDSVRDRFGVGGDRFGAAFHALEGEAGVFAVSLKWRRFS